MKPSEQSRRHQTQTLRKHSGTLQKKAPRCSPQATSSASRQTQSLLADRNVREDKQGRQFCPLSSATAFGRVLPMPTDRGDDRRLSGGERRGPGWLLRGGGDEDGRGLHSRWLSAPPRRARRHVLGQALAAVRSLIRRRETGPRKRACGRRTGGKSHQSVCRPRAHDTTGTSGTDVAHARRTLRPDALVVPPRYSRAL
jgi:hypothetical protein